MNRAQDFETDTDLEAAEWAVRRKEGLSLDERAEFDAWLARAPANWRAYNDYDRIWDELGEMDLRVASAPASDSRRRWLAGVSAAAACLVAAVVGVQVLSARPDAVYASGRGEVRTVRLADGSSVTLGAASTIAVRFDEGGRHVELRRGEAMFDVTRDPRRPFEVRAADTQVTVLGTRFSVKAAPDAVRVDVVHGVVQVAKAKPPLIAVFASDGPARKITRGERLESRRGEPVQPLPSTDPTTVAPWTEGRLVYENASLAEVVADMNRYWPGQIDLAAEDLGELRVTAALNQDQIGQFLSSLPVTLPVSVQRGPAGQVIIEAAG